MKRIFIVVTVIIMLLCSIFFIEFELLRTYNENNKKESEEILKIAYKTINDENIKKNTNIWSKNKIKKSKENNSEKMNEVEQVTNVEENKKNEKYDESNIIGVLLIPKLGIEAPIQDGTSQEIMKTSVGHFMESDYWDGNVSLASHNGGTNAHYFQNLYMLDINDEIKYITKFGIKEYKVESIKEIESVDWSFVVGNHGKSDDMKNTITLITCINGKPNYRLCVRGVEVKS